MWLDDSTINVLLGAGDRAATTQALEAIATRAQWSDPPALPPLDAGVLAPFEGDIPPEVLDRFVSLLLNPESGVAAPNDVAAAATLAATIAYHASAANGFQLALDLKAHPRGLALAAGTLDALPAHLDSLALDRPPRVAAFISALLDGIPSVREATRRALAAWPETPATRAVLSRLG